jgi:hypothetical protein
MDYGFVKVFRTIATNGGVEHWVNSKLDMTELECVASAEKAIENYHRGLKTVCNCPASSYRDGSEGFFYV